MKCPNCGHYNINSNEFCTECGARIKEEAPVINNSNTPNTTNILIISAAVIICVLLVVCALAVTGFGSVDMVNQDFGDFTMDVPVGSNFVQGLTSYGGLDSFVGFGFIFWNNEGEHSDSLLSVNIEKNMPLSLPSGSTFLKSEGSLDIYNYVSSETGGQCYLVTTSKGNYNFILIGGDLKCMEKAANSIVVK